jgi:hypothetical protein
MKQSLDAWLAVRHPPAVMDLDKWVSRGGDGAPVSGPESRVGTLTALAMSALESALERPGRVRDSAFQLLAADALLTYACEAALECEDAEGTLLRVLDGASTR